ncbi:MAG: hypothetical protein IAE94_01800 [Chthoniobacterales bacterium]|nr:hypothetical protein [Chthoniobacterales bacterium]
MNTYHTSTSNVTTTLGHLASGGVLLAEHTRRQGVQFLFGFGGPGLSGEDEHFAALAAARDSQADWEPEDGDPGPEEYIPGDGDPGHGPEDDKPFAVIRRMVEFLVATPGAPKLALRAMGHSYEVDAAVRYLCDGGFLRVELDGSRHRHYLAGDYSCFLANEPFSPEEDDYFAALSTAHDSSADYEPEDGDPGPDSEEPRDDEDEEATPLHEILCEIHGAIAAHEAEDGTLVLLMATDMGGDPDDPDVLEANLITIKQDGSRIVEKRSNVCDVRSAWNWIRGLNGR